MAPRDRGESMVSYALALTLVVVASLGAIRFMAEATTNNLEARSATAGAPDLTDSGFVPPTTTATTPTTTATTPTTTTPTVSGSVSLSATTNPQGSNWSATVTVLVKSQSNQPVQDVLVTGAWDESLGGNTTCLTAANGLCSMTQANMEARDHRDPVLSVMFGIVAVEKPSHPGFSYTQTPPTIGPINRP